MPGPPPKDPKLRQRRNRASTQATLRMAPSDGSPAPPDAQRVAETPKLPPRRAGEVPWHPDTLQFWTETWASPMAAEYIKADIPGLVILARLVDRFNYGAVELAAEIRLQRQCFGLTPLDRRRLQWEIDREAPRRQPAAPIAATAGGVRDPRRNLRAVK